MLYYSLIIVLFMEYMRPQTFLPIVGVLKINVFFPIFIFCLSFISDNKYKLKNSQIFHLGGSRWLLFLVFLIAISTLISEVTLYSFKIFKSVFGYLLLYWMTVREVNTLNKLKGVIVLLLLIHISLVILNPHVITNPATRSYIEGVTFLGDGNDFALSILIILPLVIFLYQDENNKFLKGIYLFGSGALVFTIIGTQSRGATLSLIVLIFYQWFKSKNKLRGILVVCLIGISVSLYAPPEYFGRINTINRYQEDGSAMGRINAWKSAVRMAIDNPLTGVGAGHFPMNYATKYIPNEYSGRNIAWKTAHSIYFLALGELGLPGFIFIFATIWCKIKRWDGRLKVLTSNKDELKIKKLIISINSALISFGSAGAFLSALYYPHIFILMALFASCNNIIRNEYPEIYSKIF
jgi:probable O-glycosylation ligase (exosortase A-associated)